MVLFEIRYHLLLGIFFDKGLIIEKLKDIQ